jgi:hypothetical protein
MGKILVLYVFHEINERVELFFNKCIFKDDNVDFIVISNGYKENLNLPSYVKIIRRNNLGFDFGGWSEAILRDELYKNYEYFIFLNSSVTGMFIPDYYIDRWTSIFINGLNEDNNVKLYGITINTERDPLFLSHVQSYFFCMNKSTLNFLIDRKIFILNYNTTNKDECIQQKEILMSNLALGFDVETLFGSFASLAKMIFLSLIGIIVLFAAIDLFLTRREFDMSVKMTKEEAKLYTFGS